MVRKGETVAWKSQTGWKSVVVRVFVQRRWNDKKFCPREGFVISYFVGRTFVNDNKV